MKDHPKSEIRKIRRAVPDKLLMPPKVVRVSVNPFYPSPVESIMTDKRIFVEKEMLCPACKISALQRYPNPKMFAAGSRDEDKRITSYNWAGGIKTDVQPHHYAVLMCHNCMFADFRESYESPKHGHKENVVLEAIHNAPFDRRLILRKLHRFIPKDHIDAEGAVATHLSAIYITLLPEDETLIDHMKLGRLALRLSWLYREKYGPTTPTAASTAASPAATGTEAQAASPLLAAIANALQELKQHHAPIADRLAALLKTTEDRSRELSFNPDQNPYSPGFKTASEGLQTFQKGIALLQQTLERDKIGGLSPIAPPKPPQTNNHNSDKQSLEDFLPSLVPQWPTLPRDETSAIKMAVKAFDYSFKHEDNEQTIQQAMAVVNTIIKLLMKINELEQAADYIQQIYKTGFRDKQELQMRLNQGKRDNSMNESEARNITRQIGVITNTLSMAADTRRGILVKLFERDKEKIIRVLKAKAQASPQEQEQALVQAGFHSELIPFLREQQLIKTEVKKKKWFG